MDRRDPNRCRRSTDRSSPVSAGGSGVRRRAAEPTRTYCSRGFQPSRARNQGQEPGASRALGRFEAGRRRRSALARRVRGVRGARWVSLALLWLSRVSSKRARSRTWCSSSSCSRASSSRRRSSRRTRPLRTSGRAARPTAYRGRRGRGGRDGTGASSRSRSASRRCSTRRRSPFSVKVFSRAASSASDSTSFFNRSRTSSVTADTCAARSWRVSSARSSAWLSLAASARAPRACALVPPARPRRAPSASSRSLSSFHAGIERSAPLVQLGGAPRQVALQGAAELLGDPAGHGRSGGHRAGARAAPGRRRRGRLEVVRSAGSSLEEVHEVAAGGQRGLARGSDLPARAWPGGPVPNSGRYARRGRSCGTSNHRQGTRPVVPLRGTACEGVQLVENLRGRLADDPGRLPQLPGP